MVTVKWVSLQLRCLLENLIRLSNTSIDYASMVAVKDAFNALIKSRNFNYLPSNYPYKALIKDLQQKSEAIVKQFKHHKSFRFRLTPSRKVEFIANRYILADFVPAMKFSEMNFKE